MVAANWSNRPNKYNPLPRTNGKLIKKNMTHMIAAVTKEKNKLIIITLHPRGNFFHSRGDCPLIRSII